ncbi:MAG TPA: M1 family metallopeptidase [Niabella sp.]|nr:M1 family metallopeptidase [Niabella sp.]HOZ97496.1 M1 family metallopeptidase [Niabella sp.]HQW15584.1 M1 family metallopeptidase [Niabella sp.]HQX20727.1 M1 family metallopeptidase [Niabella sp.]HQX40919.1 M1 family metallopeptidase [Niabella sp.]
MIKRFASIALVSFFTIGTFAQGGYWQQKVKYVMDIDMNVVTNRFTGKQKLTYWNNSPDTLKKVFYHLYWNAFQPGSMMDERSRRQGQVLLGGKPDWDARVKNRISKLTANEIGYQKIQFLKMNGKPQHFEVDGTILVVTLSKPILPKQQVVFDMNFEAQVPVQIRRSGRDNPKTDVRYSMSQWYPKLCEYDKEGWHATPYVGREFHGVWGDFDVNITIDKKYILGGTGYLTNAQQIGYGYEQDNTTVVQPKGNSLTWKFTAPNVHDFMWAADTAFIHQTKKINKNLTFHLLYKSAGLGKKPWEDILVNAEKAYPFIEKHFGAYPYKQYSFITGGDGGMEYPMSTLLASPGAWLHEWMHSWYQGILATNESLYPWMDEGFTSYADDLISAWLRGGDITKSQQSAYESYFDLVKSGLEEPLTTHADHYNTNFAYSIASYSKGAIFLHQLGYIVGDAVRNQILLDYYKKWKFKHPDANDFIRVAEERSGLQLGWYRQEWVNTTHTINYALDSVWEQAGKTMIRLSRRGLMPMPIDLMISDKKGNQELHYVPLGLMYGKKPIEDIAIKRIVHPAWHWTNEVYVVETNLKISEISKIEIDPSHRMADVDQRNNIKSFQ